MTFKSKKGRSKKIGGRASRSTTPSNRIMRSALPFALQEL